MLKTRVLTALALAAGLLAAMFLLPPLGWLVFAALICGGAAWEWGGLAQFSSGQRAVFAVLMVAACVIVGARSGLASEFTVGPAGIWPLYVTSALFWLVVVPFWLVRKWRLSSVAAAVVVGLIVLLPPALALAHLRLVDPWVLLAAMGAIFVSDIAAYFTGRAFGRRKLAPSISPGKTWEGAGGAVAGVVLFGLAVIIASTPSARAAGPIALLVPLLAAFTAVGIFGDLFESLLKRQAGLKDSGTILPGHGGILDRIDSLTSTLPLAGLAALWLTR
ncbi:MAG: phosphatidate cytidylyltransferase [Aromatoleum sp.]|jgi:phosphatidate cytidylyltransferase|uniref:phosphatidate cytidylyltransferase n=1 Tax=Aromatoleum sp. TaxID=2307007 RepID=UPI0028960D3E|nr:phosphatidate cytidylyltransferase [Aromatoleum sp.]MDT3671206.1 phosphatidate cytidylyltransferase [Aromatoleum sp.]